MVGRYKRHTKNFIINTDFQGRIALIIFISAILSCLLFICLLALFSADTMTISYTNNDLKLGKTPWMLLKSAAAANWIFLLIGGTLMVGAAIIGTHRIAGPLYRLEKALSKMAQGDLSTTITLREKDEGKELVDKINLLNVTISSNLMEIKRSTNAINNLLNQYGNLEETKIQPEDATSICQAIRNHNNKILSQIGHFKLRDQ